MKRSLRVDQKASTTQSTLIRASILTLIASLCATLLWDTLQPTPPIRAFGGTILPRRHFCAIGDTQRTSWLEFWREQNDAARRAILKAIAAQQPAFIVSLGDLVFYGASRHQWYAFTDFAAPLRKAQIPLFPVLGNHEYWGANKTALQHYFAHFPHLRQRRWYAFVWRKLGRAAIGLVFLDSNQGELTPTQWRSQRRWLRQKLELFDRNPRVRAVLLFLHHPPYTNSTITSDETHVQKTFVPLFRKAHKTLTMTTGHVHAYERFERHHKTFLVSGGGGGPRARLYTGARRRHKDDLYKGPALRPFHFLCFTPRRRAIQIQAMGFSAPNRPLKTLDSFSLPYPTKPLRFPQNTTILNRKPTKR